MKVPHLSRFSAADEIPGTHFSFSLGNEGKYFHGILAAGNGDAPFPRAVGRENLAGRTRTFGRRGKEKFQKFPSVVTEGGRDRGKPADLVGDGARVL